MEGVGRYRIATYSTTDKYPDSDYHVGEIDKWVIDGNDLNSFLESDTHHKATNTAKSSTKQTSSD